MRWLISSIPRARRWSMLRLIRSRFTAGSSQSMTHETTPQTKSCGTGSARNRNFASLVALVPGGEDARALRGNCDGELEVGCQRVVFGVDGPAVVAHPHQRAAGVDHRLDRQDPPLLQLRTLAGVAEDGHLRFLVHVFADAVADEGTDDREPLDLDAALDRRRDVAEVVSRPHLFAPGEDRGFG